MQERETQQEKAKILVPWQQILEFSGIYIYKKLGGRGGEVEEKEEQEGVEEVACFVGVTSGLKKLIMLNVIYVLNVCYGVIFLCRRGGLVRGCGVCWRILIRSGIIVKGVEWDIILVVGSLRIWWPLIPSLPILSWKICRLFVEPLLGFIRTVWL
jgi:hypothetical protein